MTFEEFIPVLGGLPDRMVEVAYAVPDDGDGTTWLGGFSGEVEKVFRRATPRDHFTVYFKGAGPSAHPDSVSFWPERFEGADVKGSDRSLEEVEREHREGDGAIWEVRVRQAGVLISLYLYV